MLSFNAWDIFGGEIYFLSSDSQFWTVNPATQLARVGFPVGNKLAVFNAANAYVTVHESGLDNAIYIGDGSTQWYRLNPHQVGADMSGENVSVWSPRAVITGGVQMLQSLVTAPGVHKLPDRRDRNYTSLHPETRSDCFFRQWLCLFSVGSTSGRSR